MNEIEVGLIINEEKVNAVKGIVQFLSNTMDGKYTLSDIIRTIGNRSVDSCTRTCIDIGDILYILDQMMDNNEIKGLEEININSIILSLKSLSYCTHWYIDKKGNRKYMSTASYYRSPEVVKKIIDIGNRLKYIKNPFTYYDMHYVTKKSSCGFLVFGLLTELSIIEDISADKFREIIPGTLNYYSNYKNMDADTLACYMQDTYPYIKIYEKYDKYMEVIMDDIAEKYSKNKSGISKKTSIIKLEYKIGEDGVEEMFNIMKRFNDEVKEYEFFKSFRRYYTSIVTEELLD